MEYKIKTLQTRGNNHDLHCEDEFLVYEDEKYIVCSVFDGCSSGENSHIASYTHKKFLEKTIKNYLGSEIYVGWKYISKKLIYELSKILYDIEYNIGKEMLSTIILLVINKKTEEYEITFCGDGVSFVNDEYINVHDPNGDTVWYLSTINPFSQNFENYFSQCKIIKGQGIENICISTDGIDTFKDKYGQIVDARDYFCNNEQFENTDNQLKRLYNIFTKGLNAKDKVPCINYDDFTMIKIKKNYDN